MNKNVVSWHTSFYYTTGIYSMMTAGTPKIQMLHTHICGPFFLSILKHTQQKISLLYCFKNCFVTYNA